jgi:gas vesicle protein
MEQNDHSESSDSARFSMSRFLAGFSLGVAAGAGIALAFAPDRGEATRERIAEAGAAVRERAGDTFSDVADKAHEILDATRAVVCEWIDRSKDAIEQMRERLDEALIAGQEAYTARRKELDAKVDSLLED